MRAFQNRLMVAALSCGMEKQYDAFIEKFDSALGESGRTMKRWFDSRYGRGGKAELNAHVTRLANQASMESFEDRKGFCLDAVTKLDHAMSLDDEGFNLFTAQEASRYAETSHVCVARR